MIDLTGCRFSHLMVQAKTDERRHGQMMWRCLCDCGREKLIISEALRSGGTKTCGCSLNKFYKNITLDYLKEILDYSPDTGLFHWKRRSLGCVPGAIAGTHVGRGYMRVRIHGVNYFAHRLAWFYVHGTWPTHEIDHVDRDARNNRIKNLRACENSNNAINKPAFRNNTSGYKGVTWHKGAKRWTAQIDVRGRHMYLGLFDTAQEAAQSYDKTALEQHGAFAYLNFKDAA